MKRPSPSSANLRVAPYGSWRSPITAQMVAGQSLRFEHLVLDGDDVYWTELRPAEGGRSIVVRRTRDGRTADVTPPPFSVRTRVHEYGGGAFVVAGATVYFSNFADQRLYRQDLGGRPTPITPTAPNAGLRYADAVVDTRRNRLICVREDHTAGAREAENSIVAVDLSRGAPEGDPGTVLAGGADFYASPRLSPDGKRLAWISWRHPNMPWDGTDLWAADVEPDGTLGNVVHVAGGPAESVVHPQWSPAGHLHFVSDCTGWWNLYYWRESGGAATEFVEPLYEMEAEFEGPAWQLGACSYDFWDDDRIVCAYTQAGFWRLALLHAGERRLDPLDTPYTDLGRFVRVHGNRAVFDAGSPAEPASIVQLDLGSGRIEVLCRAAETALDPGYLSVPQPIEFPTEGGLTAHGFFYPPQNRDFAAPSGELPPLLVRSHGGPTSAARTSLQLGTQFWTSRGVAVLDVNYGGSTGYGRVYRQRLNGAWGIVDVDDCVNGARYLAAQGLVDGDRMAISGGSAGGYTTLCALTFRNVFRAGASYFGVSDLEALATDTHKFESRYLDSLVGPYPERRDLYRERSPINFAGRLSCPVIFFQGLEDKVVPPNQAERMVAALAQKGVPVAYLPFEGEQHGFRRAEHIARALEAELYFYGTVFGFQPADTIKPVPIRNLTT